ncbi:ATP-binding protein [Bacillus sp. 2205SS5-2]|uniref:ATP-binding protein n=1 Tax=Bacillus sp. 2205SS5-2 TaxID=3109031 RepID=UPI0030063C1E
MFLSIIKPLLVNYTIIFSLAINMNLILPFKDRQSPSSNINFFYGISFGFTAILCMVNPIESLGETNFDLRMVLIIVSTLYFGWAVGAITTIVVSIGRYLIGGEFFLVGIMINLIAFFLAILFRKSFMKSEKKFQYCIVLFIPYVIMTTLILKATIDFLDNAFYFVYNFLFLLTFVALVYLIEKLLQGNKQIDEAAYFERLQTVGHMAAAFAHELRNPLTTVRGFIQHLSEADNHQKLPEFSPLILEELDRTNRIVTDYLSLAKPGQMKHELFHVQLATFETIQLLKPVANLHNVSLQYQDSNEDFILGDKHYFKQCLLNILNNAMEAIEDQGKVTVETRADKSLDMLTITVTDNGVGMSANELEKIGLPYYTTKTKGTGIGSMVVNKIIRDMNGSVHYYSEKDKWTRVELTLPLSKEKPLQ